MPALDFGMQIVGEHKKQNMISSAVRFCQHDFGPSDAITQLLLIRCQILSTQLWTFRCHHSTFTHSIIFLLTRRQSTTNQHNHDCKCPQNHHQCSKQHDKASSNKKNTFNRRWKSAFGASPEVCCLLWNKINPYKTMPTGVDPKHLLWALYFLTVYDTEHNSAHSLGKVDEKTYQKWLELFVDAISHLECEVVRFISNNLILSMMHHALRTNLVLYSPQIVWDNQYLGDCGNKAFITLDGTDMPAQIKLSKTFMYQKFKGNGLNYKVGVCIATGQIVWIHGPS
jgi:hypothetical protein